MCFDAIPYLIRDKITSKLEFLQLWKVGDARERIHLGERPDNLLKFRSCSVGEGDVGDGRALNDKNVELGEIIVVEDKLAFIIRVL